MTTLSAWVGARLLAGLVGATPAPPSLAVVVDASVEDGDGLAARLVAGLEPLVPLLPPTSGVAASVHVSGELLDFRVGLSLGSDEALAWSWCPCTHAELVAHVQRRLAHALRPAASCPPPAPLALLPVRVGPRPAPPPEPHVPARGRHGRGGVVLVGAGGLALGTGLGLMLTARLAADEQWAPHSNLRIFGTTSIVAGTCALAAGALLLLFDRHRDRHRDRHIPGARHRAVRP